MKAQCKGCGGMFAAQKVHADMNGDLWHETCLTVNQGLVCTEHLLCAWCEANSDDVERLAMESPKSRIQVHAECYERMQ